MLEICMIVNIFSMHKTIIVSVRILVGAPADMPARPKKLYGQPHYFQILSAFLYDF